MISIGKQGFVAIMFFRAASLISTLCVYVCVYQAECMASWGSGRVVSFMRR